MVFATSYIFITCANLTILLYMYEQRSSVSVIVTNRQIFRHRLTFNATEYGRSDADVEAGLTILADNNNPLEITNIDPTIASVACETEQRKDSQIIDNIRAR